jgi:CO/xanthine dehydrogenase Mo-binding subunit
MTGFLHEKEFSRKSFLKGGGALIVGFSLTAVTVAENASAAAPTSAGYLPDPNQIDSWLTINADNTATLKTSEVEVGNGLITGFLMIAAEELGMDMSQMHYGQPDTWVSVSSGLNAGSFAMSNFSPAVRGAAVAANQALLGLASTTLGVPVGSLSVSKGVVSGGGKTVTYGQLIGGKLFSIAMPASFNMASAGSFVGTAGLAMGAAPAKPVSNYTIIGTSPPRIDIPAKVSGTYTYLQNVRLPGLIHARIVRPRGQGAVTSVNNQPLSVDESSINHIPDAKVVRIQNFLAVVAPKEYDAIQAAAQLKVVWKSDPKLAGSGNFWSNARTQADALPARYTTTIGDVAGKLASAAKVVSATYQYQYNGHMSIGPTCAVADVQSDHATIYSNTQYLTNMPATIAAVLPRLPAAKIRVLFYEGSSSYGPGSPSWTDAAPAAALISDAIGKPVRLQFMRWDEHTQAAYGPATLYDVRGGIDAAGNIVALDWVSYTQAGTSLNLTNELVGQATWPATPAVGGASTSDTIYKVATQNKRVLAKSFPLYSGYFRSSALRAPGAQQSHFAGEQIVDELAYAANMDPVAFRRQNIDGTTLAGQRWLATTDAVTKLADWQPKVANSAKQTGQVRKGRGFGFGTFANTQVALVADIEVNMKTGKIVAKHFYLAQNTGVTMNPGLVANQAEGGAIMGLSRALLEELTFNKERTTSIDWVSYPILRFKDSPSVSVVVVSADGNNIVIDAGKNQTIANGNTVAATKGWIATGAGEPTTVPPGSAVANAFFDATGVRIRQAPMSPTHVRAVLKAAGVV